MRKVSRKVKKKLFPRRLLLLLIMSIPTVIIRFMFSIDTYRPNLVIPIIVYLSMIAQAGTVIWFSLIGGLILDIFSYTIIGSYTIPLIILGWLICLIRDLIYSRTWYIYIVATALTTMIVSIIIYLITSYYFKIELDLIITAKDILFNMLVDSISMLILSPIFKFFLKE
ncbi:MAG: rod shape-determining protein MreD [bacterium]